ncbi:MAG: response regulator transcription factor, partial [Gemmatimonadetes bacterium]|nr:response regulator transcription factor [Gemmatimonadota bacterium]
MNVLIVDDHDIVRRGIRDTLTDAFGEIRCGEAPDVSGAWENLENSQWDAMILDISLGGESGLEFLKDFRRRDADLPVLVLSMYPENLMALRALKAGANGYLCKGLAAAELPRAIREILEGKPHVSQQVTSEMMSQMAGSRDEAQSSL